MIDASKESLPLANRLREGLLLSVVGMVALPNLAAGQAIDTNRPGFSSPPSVVGIGEWQLETGVTYTRSNDDTRTTSLPVAEIRTGVADQIEVFLSTVTWSQMRSNSGETSGLEDMELGTKVNISDAESNTQMALMFELSVPVGDDSFSSDRWDPTVIFAWAHNGGTAIAGNVKLSKFRSGYQLDNGLKMPFSWAEAHSGFIEWEANLPEGGGGSHWLNGGYQWLIDDRTQLDFNAGVGLNDEAGDYRMGVGFSVRL